MDIGSMSASYSDIYKTASDANASKLQNQLGADYSNATDEELMDVCKQFEAYFLEQVFKEMAKTVSFVDTSSSANSTMMDYYKDQMLQTLATQSTEQNGFGLAQTLYEQMRRNYGLDEKVVTKPQ
ncbi:MAG: rod-binding protein [Bacteroidales bacterium]|nr:rod-binding protein [Lachnoclostridium sp.]MCM1383139.1 rod-binding protein [Lachnoclostridium sp.]MCM1465369.1 rod-binding protein [Bacteroidales bacterium]MCM1535449.1 rod-binding protein [Clostridium sp.]